MTKTEPVCLGKVLCNSDQRDLKLGIVDQRATAEKERQSMEDRAKQSRSKLTHQEEWAM